MNRLSYGQLPYDTILTSIQSNNTLSLTVKCKFIYVLRIGKKTGYQKNFKLYYTEFVDLISSLQILIKLYGSFIYLSDLFPLSQLLSNLYDLCDEYFRTCFDEDDLMISLISYNLCKFDILLEQTIKEYNKLYIRLIEHNFKLTKIHVYT
ncbi:unnamed protein product [Rotaria sp. Silwood1]|nr:unnamed protein product [Rotaria sp. Silwood1]